MSDQGMSLRQLQKLAPQKAIATTKSKRLNTKGGVTLNRIMSWFSIVLFSIQISLNALMSIAYSSRINWGWKNNLLTTKLNFNKSPDRIKLFALIIVETFSFLKQLIYVKSSVWVMLLYILSWWKWIAVSKFLFLWLNYRPILVYPPKVGWNTSVDGLLRP